MKKNLLSLTIAVLLLHGNMFAQTITPDLQDKEQWVLINRTAESINEDGKKAVLLSEVPGDGGMVLRNFEFSEGTIELDLKGKNVLQQSFVGIAFHGLDTSTYDAVYFRPFNFMNADTARRRRAVQYISMPNFPWEKLRQDFPGKYENRVNPVPNPDGWFHVKVTVKGKQVTVYVNNSEQPSLTVEKLTPTSSGALALWVGNTSGGSFANLKITTQ